MKPNIQDQFDVHALTGNCPTLGESRVYYVFTIDPTAMNDPSVSRVGPVWLVQ